MPSWEGIRDYFYDSLKCLLKKKDMNKLNYEKNQCVKYIYFCSLDELYNLINYIENLMLEKQMNMCKEREKIFIEMTENIFNKYTININKYIFDMKEKIEKQKNNILLELNKILLPEINKIILNFIYI